MSRRCTGISAALALLAATVIVPASALGGARSASSDTVVLKDLRFHPGTLSIERGDTVTWLWRDNVDHNVTFHGFHSRTQLHGSYTVRFTHSGTFGYRCTLHEAQGMRGKIVVH